jgi:thioredoxin 1
MKRYLSLFALSAALFAQGEAKWEHDLSSGMKRAKAEKKTIFLDIWAEWCPPCQKLKKDVFPKAKAQAALKKVVATSVMTETKDHKPVGEGPKVAEQYKLEAYPTLIMLDADGKELRRHIGYMGEDELVKFIEGK